MIDQYKITPIELKSGGHKILEFAIFILILFLALIVIWYTKSSFMTNNSPAGNLTTEDRSKILSQVATNSFQNYPKLTYAERLKILSQTAKK